MRFAYFLLRPIKKTTNKTAGKKTTNKKLTKKKNSPKSDKVRLPKAKFNKVNEKLKKILVSIPKKIGVYQIKNEEGKIIYVGKAKNLHDRIKSHFFVGSFSLRAEKMREQVESVDYIETSNEVEALVLEANLIKELQPKFNILLKSDNSYLFA